MLGLACRQVVQAPMATSKPPPSAAILLPLFQDIISRVWTLTGMSPADIWDLRFLDSWLLASFSDGRHADVAMCLTTQLTTPPLPPSRDKQ